MPYFDWKHVAHDSSAPDVQRSQFHLETKEGDVLARVSYHGVHESYVMHVGDHNVMLDRHVMEALDEAEEYLVRFDFMDEPDEQEVEDLLEATSSQPGPDLPEA
jgi:hypothetical protein